MLNIHISPVDQDEVEVWDYEVHFRFMKQTFSFKNAYYDSVETLRETSDPLFVISRQQALNEIFKRAVKIYKSLKLKDYSSLHEIDKTFFEQEIKIDNNLSILFHRQSPLYNELDKFLDIWRR